MFYIGIKQVDWLLWHHRGLLIKHNVPVYMSTHTSVIVSCRIHLCFLSSPPLSFALSLSLFQPCECHRKRTTTFSMCIYVFTPPTTTAAIPTTLTRPCVLSLPCLSFVPPLLPPFLLPGSQQPRCNRLPLPLPPSSIVSAWFSSLSLSCSTQPCLAFTVQPQPNAVQPPIWAQGRGREALQTADLSRKTRRHWLLWAHLQAARIWMFADIYRFVSLQQKHTYPHCLCSRLSSHSHPLIHFK